MSARTSAISKTNRGRPSFVLALHDVHPGNRELCNTFVSDVAALGVPHLSILVVPRWHGGTPFSEDLDFVFWLRQLKNDGHDISLHGYSHIDEGKGFPSPLATFITRFYTNGEGEFFNLTEESARWKIQNGLDVFEAAGIEPQGFVAPAWLISKAALGVLNEFPFKYTTALQHVDIFPTFRRVPGRTLVASSRNAWRRSLSKTWLSFLNRIARGDTILRMAVHPRDLHFPALKRKLYTLVSNAVESREPLTYAELADRVNGEETPNE